MQIDIISETISDEIFNFANDNTNLYKKYVVYNDLILMCNGAEGFKVYKWNATINRVELDLFIDVSLFHENNSTIIDINIIDIQMYNGIIYLLNNRSGIFTFNYDNYISNEVKNLSKIIDHPETSLSFDI